LVGGRSGRPLGDSSSSGTRTASSRSRRGRSARRTGGRRGQRFIRAWLGLPRFRGGSLFSTWLYRIGVNAAHDQRLKRRTEPLDETNEPADPRDSFQASELSSALQEALNQLDEDYRVAVVLYDVLGRSYAEIAELTEVAEGTVKSRIFRGRSRLAELLGTRTAEE
jgi:RNA polymerase sigma-70 factor (ECF subfamily)